MINDCFDALSDTRRETAQSALSAAFGSAPIGAITPLGGGASSASVFRVELGRRRYLLRVEGEPSPLRNPHQYESMRIAAEAGIAPPIRYIDEVGRVAVIDFIEQQPLEAYPGGPRALAQALGGLLSRVQAAPAFPIFFNVERLELLREACDAGTTGLVSSHNDPVPNNILFDGERLWMIDWESAYRNDPLVDVAIALDGLARSSELEEILLQAWLGRAPDEALRARLSLIRGLVRLYYAGVLLSASAVAWRAAPDADLPLRQCRNFNSRSAKGGLSPARRGPSTSSARCSSPHFYQVLPPRVSSSPSSQPDAAARWLICLRFA
jgi:hypothetical protein